MRKAMRIAVTTMLPLGLCAALPAAAAHAGPAECGRVTGSWEPVTVNGLNQANGINETGQIAGAKLTNPGQVPPRNVAAVWRDGQVTELGYLFGAQLRGPNSVATGIDDKGNASGFSTHLDGKRHAFMWNGWLLRDLGTWGQRSEGHAIGNGRVGGYVAPDETSGDDLKVRRPVYWEGTESHIPGASGAEIVDVNETGGLAGNENLSFDTDLGAPGSSRAVRAFARLGADFRVLGTLGGNWSYAEGINDRGQVVGQSSTGPDGVGQDGFIWDAADGMRRLPDHDTGNAAKPVAINNAGEIVGTYRCDLGEGAAVWTSPKDDPYLLPLPAGATRASATDINDRGEIVGTAAYPGGVTQAVAWRKKN
ncbi:hypothetical protein E1200_04065 [Actinomadura sp. GC306]|uniref:hypothetical protein n=1 Tax=Actinomadura sp. GC306 TaxID=2530367 RepID=UPI00105393C2|nr:hypothetical protein [Actinomadura sp. GC306]TDC70789.1 hypothetical protein E1200_04065 [Actinomadura sp. GC306]